MLDQLIGCRLESVGLSKMSWVLELEGNGERPRRYALSSSAAVSCVGGGQDDQTVYGVIQEMLEDEVIEARYDEKDRVCGLHCRA
jgi:hypothetical protein